MHKSLASCNPGGCAATHPSLLPLLAALTGKNLALSPVSAFKILPIVHAYNMHGIPQSCVEVERHSALPLGPLGPHPPPPPSAEQPTAARPVPVAGAGRCPPVHLSGPHLPGPTQRPTGPAGGAIGAVVPPLALDVGPAWLKVSDGAAPRGCRAAIRLPGVLVCRLTSAAPC